MALQKFTNNATSQMSGTLTQGGTTLVLATGTGDKFPTVSGGDYFLVTLYELDVSSVETRIEVVKVTARTADTLTIVRDFETMTGQTGGFSYPSAPGKTVYVDLRWTAAGATNTLQSGSIGATVQAWDADLDWVAANITAAGKALLDDADASAQRTTLGLGTAATQNTGTSGATVPLLNGANTWSGDQTYSSTNMTFSGTAQRIKGDFSNATYGNRLMFQSSTTNGNTDVGFIPNGTATNTQLHLFNNSDPANATLGALIVNSAQVKLQSTYTGIGVLSPMTFFMNSTEVARLSTGANYLIGTTTDDGVNKLQVVGGAKLDALSLTAALGVANGGTGASTLTGLVKGNGTSAFTPAVAGTDYQAPIGTISGLAKGNGANALTAATAGTDYVAPGTNTTFTVAQRGSYTTLTDAATVAVDLSTNNFFRCLLGGNRTLGEPTNGAEGQSGSFTMYQDGTGSRTLAYAWCYDFAGGTAPTLSTGKYAKDILAYQVDYFRSSTVTISIASPGVVTWAGHGLQGGQKVQFTTTGALPTGYAASTTYYVIPNDANSVKLATSYANAQAGTAINTSGSQSGTHTMKAISITISAVGDSR